MSEDQRLVRKVISDWIEATANGDVARVLDLMTDDVEFLTPGQPPFGKKEFEEAGRAMNVASFSGAPDIREVVVAGDYAFARNNLSVEMTLKGAEPMRLNGPILSVFRKGDDGEWRLWRDANFVAPVK